MTLARVVSFSGVTNERMEELTQRIRQDPRPNDIPASEMMLLHDPDSETSLAILFFENEDDYRRGDATLDAMPADDTPGSRGGVTKYKVAFRVSASDM